jgi:phenylacetate-coenzyme A ligase PaaK-like adenylate-forming protein
MNKSFLWLLRDKRKAIKQGPAAIAQRQHARLAEIVDYARTNSPYYSELYKNLPERVEDIRLLPVTSKNELMAHFDDWVTDRNVKIEDVRAFVNNPDIVGELYQGKYTVATTSGTTGNHGIFLMDNQAIAVNFALSLRAMGTWLGTDDIIKLLIRGGRMAVVAATDGHFLVSSGISRMRKASKLLSSAIQFFSVHTPISELVDQLNQFDPAIVIGYASVISLLGDEQAAGRLHINPVLVQPAGEAVEDYNRIANLFNAKVHDLYGATECPFLTSDCKYGWYNTDWAVIEPVNAGYQPVQPGEQSHTVLLSNLANRVQPILRYDLGDRVQMRADLCPCGNPHPAIHVQGRTADVLTFLSERRQQVVIAPLVFVTLIDRIPGVRMFQIVQTTPTSLSVRLLTTTGADPDHVWQMVYAEITQLLANNKLANVTVERAEEPPEQTPGGKYRTVIPLRRL